jgi:hypothetical protein
MLQFIVYQFCMAKFFASLKEAPENGKKKPSAKPGNRMPRVEVLNYLKKVALFFRFERDILADGAQVIGRDTEDTASPSRSQNSRST